MSLNTLLLYIDDVNSVLIWPTSKVRSIFTVSVFPIWENPALLNEILREDDILSKVDLLSFSVSGTSNCP